MYRSTVTRSAPDAPRAPVRLEPSDYVRLAASRLRRALDRPVLFSGAYPDRESAIASLPEALRAGYDDEALAPVLFETMCQVLSWDYPVIYWLQRWMEPGRRIADVGGHLGTKYIAFQRLLPVETVTWTVSDLPAMMRVARRQQAAGLLPAEIRFTDDVAEAGAADILLASGLLQYLDRPFSELVAAFPEPPRHLVLNKVAQRDGPMVVTLQQIGRGRVPYQIRSRAAFEAEIDTMGYRVCDRWVIPELSHRIPTHPWLGDSESVGYALERR